MENFQLVKYKNLWPFTFFIGFHKIFFVLNQGTFNLFSHLPSTNGEVCPSVPQWWILQECEYIGRAGIRSKNNLKNQKKKSEKFSIKQTYSIIFFPERRKNVNICSSLHFSRYLVNIVRRVPDSTNTLFSYFGVRGQKERTFINKRGLFRVAWSQDSLQMSAIPLNTVANQLFANNRGIRIAQVYYKVTHL